MTGNNDPHYAVHMQRQSQLFTRKEAAEYLGVSEQTLAIWKCTGRYNLPYVKIGRLIKYKKADLDAFIARNSKSA